MDTFESEEEIDLSGLAAEITAVDKEQSVQNELLSQFDCLTADDEETEASLDALKKALEGLCK